MFIKSIEITGFKSYRDKLVLEFDEHVNVIVGKNGSGKSNVFDAIRFVLGDMFGSMRANGPGDLLHESTGERALAAEVKITFNNASGRLPIEGEVVSLSRTLGLKKDEYFLNGKAARKTDVVNLLESAGFSRSNPYYIVAQGKVVSLTNMTDAQRISLIKEVAGTHVYEERRKESLAILEEANAKRAQIHEVLREMDNRVAELEGETAELDKFVKLETKRRAIEYRLFSAELAKAQLELDDVAKSKEDESKQITDKREEHEAATAEVARLEKEVKALSEQLRNQIAEKQSASEALPRLSKKRARLAASVADSERKMTQLEQERDAHVEEMEGLQMRITALQERLHTELVPQEEEARSAYNAIKADSSKVSSRLDALINKQNRFSQFKTKKDRDQYLNAQIRNIDEQLMSKSSVVAALKEDAGKVDSRRKALETSIALQEREVQASSAKLASLDDELHVLRDSRTAASQELRDLFRQQAEAEQEIKKLREAAEASERAMHAATPPAIRQGLEAVRAMSEELSGIHGPLIDLFRPNHPRHNTAVEVIAMNQLFNVVVDDETVASTIIENLVSRKAGRVTLMPLAQLKEQSIDYPVDDDCRPLISFLEFDPKYKPCIQQVFGRVLLCRNLEVASKYAKSHGFTCVTLEGDLVNKKGAIQGGFVEVDASRLMHVAALYQQRIKAVELEKAKRQLDQDCLKCDQQLTGLRGQEHKVEESKSRVRENNAHVLADIDRNKASVEDATKTIAERQSAIHQVESEIAALKDQLVQLQQELASDMSATLSASETAELEALSARNDILNRELGALVAALEQASQARLEVETDISENLGKRMRELQGSVSRLSKTGASSSAAESLEDELMRLRGELSETMHSEQDAQAEISRLETEIQKSTERVEAVKQAAERAKTAVQELKDALDNDRLRSDKLLERRRAALKKKEECTLRIRDIGTIPSTEVQQLEGIRRRELASMLAEVQEALKKMPSVNKKAADQYQEFYRQREQLLERKGELDRGDVSIRDLINSLDMKKDEAIMRTFKQVAKNFKEVFAELVPRGSGTLRLITDMDAEEAFGDEDLAGEAAAAPSKTSAGTSDRYRGLSVNVSFEDPLAESQHMNHLSGGQKSLVALALIFAIQRADPAPFYLFDEVDSALDAVHRSAVANMIFQHAEKASAQFLVTTFRPELATVADRWFGVEVGHKVSTVRQQDKESSLAFISAIMEEEGALDRSAAYSSADRSTAYSSADRSIGHTRLSTPAKTSTSTPATAASAARSKADSATAYPPAKRPARSPN